MKKVLKDENGFPLNYDTSSYYMLPEIMQPVPCSLFNIPPNVYFVTTWGRLYNAIKNTYAPKELIKKNNFHYVAEEIRDANGNAIRVQMHELVALVFVIFRPIKIGESVIVNHIDGIKWHNEPYNLEWLTQSENVRHADNNDLIQRPYGEDNGQSALTDDQYHEICRLTELGYLAHEVNTIMNLGTDITNIVQKIRNGTSETLISQQYDFSNIPRNDYRKFSKQQVITICECFQDHPTMSYTDILYYLGFDIDHMDKAKIKKLRDTLSCIKRRVSYIEISKDFNF